MGQLVLNGMSVRVVGIVFFLCIACTQCAPCNDRTLFGAVGLVNNESFCVFNTYYPSTTPVVGQVTIHETPSIPNSQGYAHATNAILYNDRFYVCSSRGSAAVVDVSWSQWGEFFHLTHRDSISLTTTDICDADVVVHRPTFYLPILTFHVGHILIDTIEQIYSTMIANYGTIRVDALFILDVADEKERDVLQDKIRALVYDARFDNYGAMLRWFTSVPILSALTLQRSQLRLLFADLHIGLDIEHTYFNRGYHYHPHAMNIADRSVQTLAVNYQRFRDYIHMKANLKLASSFPPALFIRRESSRVVLNMQELISRGHELKMSFDDIDLDGVGFSKQLQLFYNADVLVATAGTALHNMLFMRPGTSVIILMQPEWCDWAWQYSNQAVLLGIYATILCRDEVQYKYFSWTKSFWRQGPRMTKLANFTVDADMFSLALKKVDSRKAHGAKSVEYFRAPASLSQLSSEPPLRIVLTSASARTINREGEPVWEVRLMGELVASSSRNRVLFESMPHLTVCIELLPGKASQLCCRLDSLMYFGSYIAHSNDPVMWLHYWALVSPDGMKIRHSDGYSVIDIREEQPVHTRSASTFSLPLVLVNKEAHRIGNFTDLLMDRHSFTHGIAQLCRDNDLEPVVCIEYVPKLTNYARKMALISSKNLPVLQLVPSWQNPFVLFVTDPAVDVLYKRFALAFAKHLGVHHAVLCAELAPCDHDGSPVHLDAAANSTIVAGNYYLAMNHRDLSCAMVITHPMQRLILLYYRYCYEDAMCIGYRRRLSSLSRSDVKSLRSVWTKNNLCGVLSNYSHCNVSHAIKTAEKCVIVIMENISSLKRLFSHWFPWMRASESTHDYLSSEYLAVISEFESFDVLDVDIKSDLVKLMESDMYIYNFISDRISIMRAVADYAGFLE